MNNNENNGTNKATNNSVETPQIITPSIENTTESTPQSSNKPQVVEAGGTSEVNKQVANPTNNNQDINSVPTSVKPEENNTVNKKGHPVFLVLLMVFLFAFVFFLPDITEYITNYMNEKNGVNELKSGRMNCSFSNSTENIDYTYNLTFRYEKNRLKSSTSVTTNRLADSATDSNILTERENSCQLLKTFLDENDIGMTAECSVSAAVQITTQNIDYKKLDIDFISSNLAELEGFYPEYELDESVTTIENDLENSGYTCERIES